MDHLNSTCLQPGQEPPVVKPFGTSNGQDNPAGQPQAAKENTKGKTRRGKKRRPTEKTKRARRERRKAKRQEKRKEARRLTNPTRPKINIKVTTWNLQGIAMHGRKRNRLRCVTVYAHQERWEIVLISELRAKFQGVIWLREENTQTAIIHS